MSFSNSLKKNPWDRKISNGFLYYLLEKNIANEFKNADKGWDPKDLCLDMLVKNIEN